MYAHAHLYTAAACACVWYTQFSNGKLKLGPCREGEGCTGLRGTLVGAAGVATEEGHWGEKGDGGRRGGWGGEGESEKGWNWDGRVRERRMQS